jgi:hypothetical protein
MVFIPQASILIRTWKGKRPAGAGDRGANIWRSGSDKRHLARGLDGRTGGAGRFAGWAHSDFSDKDITCNV